MFDSLCLSRKFCPKIIVANKEDLRMDPRAIKGLEV